MSERIYFILSIFCELYAEVSIIARVRRSYYFSMNKDWQSFLHEKGEYDYYSAYVVLEHAGF